MPVGTRLSMMARMRPRLVMGSGDLPTGPLRPAKSGPELPNGNACVRHYLPVWKTSPGFGSADELPTMTVTHRPA